MMVCGTFIKSLYTFIKEGAEEENVSMSQFVCNSIEKYFLVEHTDPKNSFSNLPGLNTKPIEMIDKLKDKLKSIHISLDKRIYLLVEEKIKQENISRVEFIRKATIEYLSVKYPDMRRVFIAALR
jgi:hypothetical protein